MRVTFAVAVAASLAVGCGSAASAPGAPAGEETSLKISFWPSGRDGTPTKPKRWTLRCDPAGGTHPNDVDACRKLKALKQPFKPLRRDVVCTQRYGGPQQGTVSGTYLGRRVLVSLSLADGCQIERFTRLAFLFPGFRLGSLDS